MLTRSDLCSLSGLSMEKFKYLVRHGKIQLITGYEPPIELMRGDDASRGWRTYSADDVVQVALFVEATERGGLGFDDARYAVANGFIKLREGGNPIRSSRPSEDVWIAAAVHLEGFKSTFAGTLSDVGRYVAKHRKESGSEITQFWAANASMEFRSILARASLDKSDLLMRFLDAFRESILSQGS